MAAPRVNPLAKLLAIFLLAVGAALVYQYRGSPPRATSSIATRPETASATDFFSPEDNLERADLDQLGRARKTIDIAMYAFTDRFLAERLVALAQRGVVIRVYRDRRQYEEEQRRRSGSVMELFRGQPNIHVRVKRSRELMHLKAYLVDRVLLRDGSANWSPSGLKQQDNNARFTTDPAQVHAFQQAFEQMWSRSRNEVAQ